VSPVASDTLAGVLDHVTVTRYVTPLREGGSLPALVEADNLGTYVMKFRGAGQGPLALVAEIIAGELARRLDLRGSAGFDPLGWTAGPDFASQVLWFDALVQNVLRDRATRLAEAHAELAPRITEALLNEVTALVPGEWFGDRGASAYTEHLLTRAPIVPEVIRE
jgi:hypothetical protein